MEICSYISSTMNITKYSITCHGFFSNSYKIWEGKSQLYKVKTGWWLKEIMMFDMNDREIFRIKRRWNFIVKKFELIINNEVRAEFTSTSSFKNNMDISTVAGLYFVEGNFWGNDYTIENEHEPIAKIARNNFKKTRYGIAIKPGNDNVFILGIVLTIELLTRIKQAERS